MLAIPSDVLAMVESGRYAIRWMVRFDLDSADGGSTGIWNDTYSTTVGGVTYGPLAGNMEVDQIPGSAGLDSERVSVRVSNLLPAVTGIMSNKNWHQRPCTVYRAFLNEAGAIVFSTARFSGFLDDVEISDVDQGACVLTISIESNNRELGRSNGRIRSDGDQRTVASTDGFFKHTAAAASNSNIFWGRKGPQTPN